MPSRATRRGGGCPSFDCLYSSTSAATHSTSLTSRTVNQPNEIFDRQNEVLRSDSASRRRPRGSLQSCGRRPNSRRQPHGPRCLPTRLPKLLQEHRQSLRGIERSPRVLQLRQDKHRKWPTILIRYDPTSCNDLTVDHR
jgi:hypothetical protein